MLLTYDQATHPVNWRPSRRAFLCAGGLSALGLAGSELARLRAATTPGTSGARHGKNSCVFLFLFGGPSHIDLWDMKPKAPAGDPGRVPADRHGVPGIQLCEHLPLLARPMDGSACSGR